ncbi:MAG: T9SS type A sorting domain-containing protein [Flavobacteriales bacterium]|nr:T9SS type A sorting domain-containing protein [Flavobacteriales bacterium]
MAQSWTIGEDIPQGFRASNVAAYNNPLTNDNYLFLISGRDSNGNITPRNQRYDITNNVWEDMANSPTGILGASTAIVKDSIYIIGGLTTTPGNAIKKVRMYSINQNTWTDKADFPVNIVDSDAVAYQDSLIYVTAGYNSRVRIFNTIKNQWRDATPMTTPLESIAWGALTIHGNKLIYICGTDGFFSPNYFNTVRIGTIDQSNRANISWTTGTSFPGQTRTFFDAHTWENGIIMTGGSTDNSFETNSDECYVYNVDSDTWIQQPSKPTSWVTGNSASLFTNNQWKLICASGYNNSGYLLNTEIFSSTALSYEDFENNNRCRWENFRCIQNRINFCVEEEVELDLKLYDSRGVLVFSCTPKKYQVGENSLSISDALLLQEGLYFCNISSENKSETKKIIVRN